MLLSTHVAGDLGEDVEAPSAPATSRLVRRLALLGGLRRRRWRRRLVGHGACGSLLALAQADGSKLQPPVGSRFQPPADGAALRAVHVGCVGPSPISQGSRGRPFSMISLRPGPNRTGPELRTPSKPQAAYRLLRRRRAERNGSGGGSSCRAARWRRRERGCGGDGCDGGDGGGGERGGCGVLVAPAPLRQPPSPALPLRPPVPLRRARWRQRKR